MTRVREPDTVTRNIASDKPMECLQQRFQCSKLSLDLGATDRHDIRACGEERCSAILRLIREDDHICRIKTSTSYIHDSGYDRGVPWGAGENPRS
jgi:hypothetical protein